MIILLASCNRDVMRKGKYFLALHGQLHLAKVCSLLELATPYKVCSLLELATPYNDYTRFKMLKQIQSIFMKQGYYYGKGQNSGSPKNNSYFRK